jgi:hypothetical protein
MRFSTSFLAEWSRVCHRRGKPVRPRLSEAGPVGYSEEETTTRLCGCAGGCASSTRSGDARAELIHSRTFTGTSGSYACAGLGTTCRGRRREVCPPTLAGRDFIHGIRRILNELQIVVDGAKAVGRGEADTSQSASTHLSPPATSEQALSSIERQEDKWGQSRFLQRRRRPGTWRKVAAVSRMLHAHREIGGIRRQ